MPKKGTKSRAKAGIARLPRNCYGSIEGNLWNHVHFFRDHVRTMDASDATSIHSESGLGGGFVAGLWRWFASDRDTRHWLAAERAFLAGDVETALRRYRRVQDRSVLSGKARLMDDWIRFQHGDY